MPIFLSIRLSRASIDSKRILHAPLMGMTRKKGILQIYAPPVENLWVRHCSPIVQQSHTRTPTSYTTPACIGVSCLVYTSLTTVATVALVTIPSSRPTHAAPLMPPFARPRRCLVNAQSTKEIEQILKKVKAYNFPCCYLVELLALGLCWRRGVVVSGVRQ